MAHKHETHQKHKHLPATGIRARDLGETYYFTGKRCSKGHLSPRYASSGNCVECIAEKRGKVAINYKGRSSKRSFENQKAAMDAIEKGFTEYKATSPCPYGHYRRYVTNNNCIECNDIQRTQRSQKAKWARIKKEYGLSAEQVLNMLNMQKGKCSICDIDISNYYHIDHCHKSGKVRSLLCSKCNQAIGLMQEDASLFQKAAKYIEAHYET